MKEQTGKKTIDINGHEYYMVPDFKAMVKIEALAERSIPRIIDDFAYGNDTRLTDIVAILYACALSGSQRMDMTYNEFGNEVMNHGFPGLTIEAITLISEPLSGGKKKVKTQAQKKPETKLSGTDSIQ